MKRKFITLAGLVLATLPFAPVAMAQDTEINTSNAVVQPVAATLPTLGRNTGVIINRGPEVAPTPTPARERYDPTRPGVFFVKRNDRTAGFFLYPRRFGYTHHRTFTSPIVFRNGDVTLTSGGASVHKRLPNRFHGEETASAKPEATAVRGQFRGARNGS